MFVSKDIFKVFGMIRRSPGCLPLNRNSNKSVNHSESCGEKVVEHIEKRGTNEEKDQMWVEMLEAIGQHEEEEDFKELPSNKRKTAEDAKPQLDPPASGGVRGSGDNASISTWCSGC